MGLKAEFIDLLRQTPDGIAAFLTEEIPEPPEISQPATTDDAVIAQGILSYYLLEVFRPFAGVTPVELLLRIGQHNNVVETMCLAGLEYLADTNTQQDFTVEEPIAETKYAQGDVRIIVSAKNGTIQSVGVAVTTPSTSLDAAMGPVSENDNKTFMGFARCEEIGDYTFDVTVTFSDNSTASASVDCEIAAPGNDTTNPEGTDMDTFNASLAVLDKYYQETIKAATGTEPVTSTVLDLFASAAKSAITAAQAMLGTEATGITAVIDTITIGIQKLYE